MNEIVARFGIFLILPLYFVFILWFVFSRYLPRYYVKITREESAASPYRIACLVRRIFSVMHGLLLIGTIIAPLLFYTTYVSADDPERADPITVSSAFKLDQSLLPDLEISGVNDTSIKGVITMTGNTSSQTAHYLFDTGILINLLFGLYFGLHARNLFASLSLGKAFTRKNATRLKKMAFVTIASQITVPLINYVVWRSALQHVSFNTGGFQLRPPFLESWGPHLNLIVFGLALLVLSGVLKEAKQVTDEQRLTI